MGVRATTAVPLPPPIPVSVVVRGYVRGYVPVQPEVTTLGTIQVGTLQLGVLSEPPDDVSEPKRVIERAPLELLATVTEWTGPEDGKTGDTSSDAGPPLTLVYKDIPVEAPSLIEEEIPQLELPFPLSIVAEGILVEDASLED